MPRGTPGRRQDKLRDILDGDFVVLHKAVLSPLLPEGFTLMRQLALAVSGLGDEPCSAGETLLLHVLASDAPPAVPAAVQPEGPVLLLPEGVTIRAHVRNDVVESG